MSKRWKFSLTADAALFGTMYIGVTTGNDIILLCLGLAYWAFALGFGFNVWMYTDLSNHLDELDEEEFATLKLLHKELNENHPPRSILFYLYDTVTDVSHVMLLWMVVSAPVTAVVYATHLICKPVLFGTMNEMNKLPSLK